ncbi:MAG: YraN family protein, partial [Candidatus Aminicenantes bacterium]|nr:YraN family protein [Candidatus Aminicenantes bacterium]
GEIDIVARDGTTLVFVEVKARADESFGRPEESVTPGKQRQIRKIAQGYLVQNPLGGDACRFDVISILFGDETPIGSSTSSTLSESGNTSTHVFVW